MSHGWSPRDIPLQTGKRFYITGGNSGIGYWAAVGLARKGASVVLACRDLAKGRAALARLEKDAHGEHSAASLAEVVELDLASLESVRGAAERELARGLPLHGLINNAGVMAPPRRRETEDGFELQFGTNVLGHFALTCQLLPALEQAASARVVTVASIAHKRGSMHFDDLQWQRRYSPQQAYAQSKLGNILFARELERRLRARGSNVTSVAVHPGVAETNLFKIGSGKGASAVAERILRSIFAVLLNTGDQGAVPTLYAATAPGVPGGAYYGPQGWLEARGGDVGPAKLAPQAKDEAAQRRLWEICEQLTGTALPPPESATLEQNFPLI